MARSHLRVRAVVTAVLVVFAAAPTAAIALAGIPPNAPSLTDPVTDKTTQTVAPATETLPDLVDSLPPAPLVSPPGIPSLDDDLVVGGGGDPGTDGAGPPDVDGDVDDAPEGGSSSGGGAGSTGSAGTRGSNGTSSNDLNKDDAPLTKAGLRAGSSDGPGGVLNLARPLAPAVVVAIIGLLLLASAARGNDRLVKREKERSTAGAWRL